MTIVKVYVYGFKTLYDLKQYTLSPYYYYYYYYYYYLHFRKCPSALFTCKFVPQSHTFFKVFSSNKYGINKSQASSHIRYDFSVF